MTEPIVKLFPYVRVDYLTAQEVKQDSNWGITAFNLPEAWKSCCGEDVVIAVLDTGCDVDHTDLIENLLPGKNFVRPGEPPEDGNCHGTHVCGILVAKNNEFGVVGVAPKAKVIPVKVLDDSGSGNLDDVAAGIRWCIEQKVDFINMSLGSPVPIQKIRDALVDAGKAGIITFCAAGNAGNTKEVFYPSAYPETIAIGAIDPSFHRACFSNTGMGLDFLAPGVDVLSTVPDNWYAKLSGTSMAGPFACGVAALMLAYARKNPNSGMVLNTITDYIETIKQYTIPVVNGNYTNPQFYSGFGIIDPRKFIEAMQKLRNTMKIDESHTDVSNSLIL